MANSLRQEDRVETLTCVAGERDSAAARYNRIKAKYGDQSPEAMVGSAWLEVLDREFAELEAQCIREFGPAPQIADDRFIIYGRVLDSKCVGVPRVTIVARSQKGSELAVIKTAEDGKFELIVKLRAATSTSESATKGAATLLFWPELSRRNVGGIFDWRIIRSHCEPRGISRNNYALCRWGPDGKGDEPP
jgi:hypothetical protein